MRKLSFIFAALTLWGNVINAQINLNINIGSQPQWGPSGYNHAEYYYIPDIETYYSVPKRQFIYLNNGDWVFNSKLPARYSNYNLYNGYKVVLNTPRPYLNFSNHKIRYAKYKGYKGKQVSLRSGYNKYGEKSRRAYSQNTFKIGHVKSANFRNSRQVHGGKAFHTPGKGNGKNKGNGKGKDK